MECEKEKECKCHNKIKEGIVVILCGVEEIDNIVLEGKLNKDFINCKEKCRIEIENSIVVVVCSNIEFGDIKKSLETDTKVKNPICFGYTRKE